MKIETYKDWGEAFARLVPLCTPSSGYGEKLSEIQRFVYAADVFSENPCAHKLAKLNRLITSLENVIMYERLKG